MSSYSASAATDNLRKLLALVNESAEDAIRQYEQAGVVPSLDTTEHLKLPGDSLALKKTLRTLEAASHQMISTLVPPMLTMYSRTITTVDIVCVRIAVNQKIADVIHGHDDGLHIKDIASATGLNELKLLRIMRALASKHCFREVSPERFANNALSMTLREEHPVWSSIYVRLNYMDRLGLDKLYDTLIDPAYAHSLNPHQSAFAYGIKDEYPGADFFDWVAHNPEFSVRWQHGLTALASVTDADTIVTQFPWAELPNPTSVCDLGSGIGLVSMALSKVHPHLRLTLQDLPSVLEQSQEVWRQQNSTASVIFVPFDFFKEGPIRDQDVYYLRQVLHDWPDDHCVSILRNIASSMNHKSRLFIHEYVLRSPCTGGESYGESNGEEKPPFPLLPNYGYGSHRGYFQDLYMLSLYNAKERTLDEFKILGQHAGLHFVKVWDLAATGVVELRLE